MIPVINKITRIINFASECAALLRKTSARQTGGQVLKRENQLRAKNNQTQSACRETLSDVLIG